MSRRLFTVLAIAMIATGALAPVPGTAATAPCTLETFATLNLPETTITVVESLPAGTNWAPVGNIALPICRVRGVIAPVNLFEVWMPVQGVVVEAHFGVEREEITALGDDQRVDLDHRGVSLDERLVDGVEELDQLAGRCPAQPHTERELAALKGGDAGSGVDVLAENLLRFLR